MSDYPRLCRLPLAAGSKRPLLVRWSTIDPADPVIAMVFAENPHAGVGLRLDQFVVVDCDSPARVTWWYDQGFPTDFQSRGNPTHRSFWYRLPDGVETRARSFPDWQIKTGPGHQCVVPPSIHPSGVAYEWLGIPIDEDSFLEIPEAPIDFLEAYESHSERPVGDGAGWDVVLEGEGRDNFLIAVAGLLRAKGMSVGAVRKGLKAFNEIYCEPRLGSRDLDRISKSSGRWNADLTFTDEDGDQFISPRRKVRR